MISTKPITYSRLKPPESLTAQLNDGFCTIESSDGSFAFRVTQLEDETHLSISASEETPQSTLLTALEHVFGHHTNAHRIELQGATVDELGTDIQRVAFYQLPQLWVAVPRHRFQPELWVQSQNGLPHPLREPFVSGPMYRRYVPRLDKTVSFRVLDPTRDLAIFMEWHRKPRVAKFWELDKSDAELELYVKNGLQDPHQIPVILEFDDAPVGYFELYWVPEDRLAPFCDHAPFDRGFHFLIGDDASLGLENTDAVLKSVCHMLFLDDPRTRTIWAEPRADNRAVLKYVETFTAWRKIKEFDFPHKRAALLECKRERFFGGGFL